MATAVLVSGVLTLLLCVADVSAGDSITDITTTPPPPPLNFVDVSSTETTTTTSSPAPPLNFIDVSSSETITNITTTPPSSSPASPLNFVDVSSGESTTTTPPTSSPVNVTTEHDNATCVTDHRLSAFPIRLIKCNIADLTCFREGKYVFGGGAQSFAFGGEPRCSGLWVQGPCDKFEWLVVDKARFYATGYIRITCAPANACPKGYVHMGFDGNCYSNKEVAVNCPKVKGFKITYNVFGEGECVCAKRGQMPVRYCDTVAVGGARPTVSRRLMLLQPLPPTPQPFN